MKQFFSLIVLWCGWAVANAQTAALSGTVTDKANGEPLPQANVEITSKNGSTGKLHLVTGLNGSFIIKHMAPGHYNVSVSYVGYDAYSAEVDLSAPGQKINVLMQRVKTQLQGVIVVGARGGERSSQLADRRADIVQNSLSARTIELSPDLSVANSAQRISGVTTERSSNGEAQYVIVRGMEKRYIYTLVNGIKIPSPDNKNRYVPLDIFPADMLERLEISKSLTPNMEGDAIGGAVNMVMKDAPAKFSISANGAVGYANDFFTQNFAKFNHGASLNLSPRQLNGPGYVTTMNDFPNSAFMHSFSTRPLGDLLGLSMGGRLFNNKLGVMVAASSQNNYRNVKSVLFEQPDEVVDGRLQVASIADRRLSVQQQRSGVHMRLDYDVNEKNKVSFYGAYLSLLKQEYRSVSDTNLELNRVGPGFGRISNSYRNLREIQQIGNFTLKGQHAITGNFSLDWTAAYSKAALNKPDEATFNVNAGVQKDPVTGDKVPDPNTLEDASREFTHSIDEDKSGYLNLAYKSKIGGANVDWTVGGMYRNKNRNSSYDEYDLRPNPGGQVYDGDISHNTFSVFNGQGTSDNPLNYSATEKVGAGYAMIKIEAGPWLLTGGARYEHTDLTWESNVEETVAGKTGSISYYDVLPSGNIKYTLGKKQALRLSYYSAISRPNFYEVIPHTLYDPESGQTEKGNPYLKRTTANNFDIRYEYFPKGLDQLLVGVFYKKLKNPIEYSITNAPDPLSTTSSSNITYYIPQNFGNATNYGLELDVTKYWKWLGIRANYTYTDSKITTTKEHEFAGTGGTKTEYPQQTRPLQGQSKHIGNFSLLFKDDNKLGLNAQLAFQFTSKRINTVSQFYNYDIWQKAFSQLDFSIEKKLHRHWYVYTKINNLLNTPYELYLDQPYYVGTVNSYAPYQIPGKNVFIRKDTYGINYLLGAKFKF